MPIPTIQPYLLLLLLFLATANSATATTTNFPLPFDTSLDNNFTNTACPNFLTANFGSPGPQSAFSTCHPLSFLLRDSSAFFSALHSESTTSDILKTACAAPVDDCTKTLSDLANDLLKKDTCRRDYELGNPLVVHAYTDLLAYEAVYHASCLRSNTSGKFCFVDALFGSSSSPPPGDYNVFFIPLGSALTHDPAGNEEDPYLSCNDCTRREMQTYADFARKDGQPLADSYGPSAQVVNRECGQGFVDANVTLGHSQTVLASSGSTIAMGMPMGLSWLVLGSVLGIGFVL